VRLYIGFMLVGQVLSGSGAFGFFSARLHRGVTTTSSAPTSVARAPRPYACANSAGFAEASCPPNSTHRRCHCHCCGGSSVSAEKLSRKPQDRSSPPPALGLSAGLRQRASSSKTFKNVCPVTRASAGRFGDRPAVAQPRRPARSDKHIEVEGMRLTPTASRVRYSCAVSKRTRGSSLPSRGHKPAPLVGTHRAVVTNNDGLHHYHRSAKSKSGPSVV
jgi:hypothetical protein